MHVKVEAGTVAHRTRAPGAISSDGRTARAGPNARSSPRVASLVSNRTIANRARGPLAGDLDFSTANLESRPPRAAGPVARATKSGVWANSS